jgi:hypothetical protein
MSLIPAHHVKGLKRCEGDAKGHCIVMQGLEEFHPTLGRGVRETIPGWVFQGAPGVGSTCILLGSVIPMEQRHKLLM